MPGSARPLRPALFLTSVVLTACTAATGHVLGGESLADDSPVAGGDDAGVTDAGADTFSEYCAEAGDRGHGSTFPDLYRDFFGPAGLASCSAQSSCHGPGGAGVATSGGYECGPDQNACWSSMTGTIVPAGGTSSPRHTTLYEALRKAAPLPGTGPMPRSSSFAFCSGDLQRIADWISSGAAAD